MGDRKRENHRGGKKEIRRRKPSERIKKEVVGKIEKGNQNRSSLIKKKKRKRSEMKEQKMKERKKSNGKRVKCIKSGVKKRENENLFLPPGEKKSPKLD